MSKRDAKKPKWIQESLMRERANIEYWEGTTKKHEKGRHAKNHTPGPWHVTKEKSR